jgi:ribosomal protein L37AE/L43A
MKGSALASRPQAIICPFCEVGALYPFGGASAHCDFCSHAVEGDVLRMLEQITSLPDALGRHACECGHPEIRRLPDGVFHCTACGSEVGPLKADPTHTILKAYEHKER